LSVRQEVDPADVLTICFRIILAEEFNANLVVAPGDAIEFEFLVSNPRRNCPAENREGAED